MPPQNTCLAENCAKPARWVNTAPRNGCPPCLCTDHWRALRKADFDAADCYRLIQPGDVCPPRDHTPPDQCAA